MEKLILVDGSSIIFRAFYALPRFTTSSNIPTSAAYGFLRMILKIVKDKEPKYLSVAFDKKAPTFRHVEFKEYKAQRPKMPDELSVQFDIVKEILEAFGIKYYELDGFEADDIIATQVEKFKNKDLLIYILSSDFDLAQLIDENVKLLVTRKGVTKIEEYDVEKFISEFGFEPKYLPDYKALVGDVSDNIEGIKGIGEKTASKIVKEFGSVENILKDEEAKAKYGILGSEEIVLRNKSLCVLVKDVPLNFNLDELLVKDFSNDRVKEVLQKYEFKSILKELRLDLDDNKESDLFLAPKEENKSLSIKENQEAAVIDIVHDEKNISKLNLLFKGEINEFDFTTNLFLNVKDVDLLVKILSDKNTPKYTNSLKMLYKVAKFFDTNLENVSLDYILALYLLDPDLEDFSVKEYSRFLDVSDNFASKKEEMLFVLQNAERIKKLLEVNGLSDVYYKIELPLSKVLFSMEQKGIKIDTNWFKKLEKDIEEKIAGLEKKIFSLANISFNILSPKQLSSVLFDVLGIKPPKDFKGSTGIATLSEIVAAHPIIPLILEYRHLVKLKNTYIDTIPSLTSKETKRLHTIFHQIGTSTGRLRSTSPNLQNLPVKDEWGINIQRGFIAEDGFSLISADYSQIELRVLAHLSNDEHLINAFLEGLDIHEATAMEIFSLKKEEVTKEKRNLAKAINFGIIYGISPYGLSKQTGMSKEESQEYINRYFSRYPKVYDYIQNSIETAKNTGFTRTIFGRRRFVRGFADKSQSVRENAKRIAINSPIQGSASDIIKLAMVKLFENLNKDCSMVLQIHDELVFEVKDEILDSAKDTIKDIMENVVSLKVPLKVDVVIGKNLGDARKWK